MRHASAPVATLSSRFTYEVGCFKGNNPSVYQLESHYTIPAHLTVTIDHDLTLKVQP